MIKLQDLPLNLLLGDKLKFIQLADFDEVATKGYQSFTVPSGNIDIDKVGNNLAKVEYKRNHDNYRHLVGFIELTKEVH